LLFNLTPELLIANLIALGLGMTLHEFAHNYVGWRMGDPEPARQGRLTLNPLVHINWIGWIMFAVLGFGILGSAPISWTRMPRENRRWRWLAAVAAGPIANLLLAIAVALVLRILIVVNAFTEYDMLRMLMSPSITSGFGDLILIVLTRTIMLNVLLFVFNLIPLFPIDGWNIVWALLPADLAIVWDRYRQTTSYIFIGLLLLSFVPIRGIPSIFGLLVGQPTNSISLFLLGV
jgi:Zn-dependent protease